MAGRTIGWWWLWTLVAALLVFAPASADAASIVRLAPCVMRDTGGPPPFDAAPNRFDCTSPQRRFGPGDYWVRPKVLPAGTGTTLTRARAGAQWMTNLTLYARYADGRIFRQSLDSHGITRHLRLGAAVEQILPARGVPVTTMLWQVRGSDNFRRIVGELELASPAASERENLRLGLLYGGVAGLCLAMLAFNMALWVAVRRPFLLAYCGMIAVVLAYASFASGITGEVAPGLSNSARAVFTYLLMPISAASSLWFARSFIGADTMMPRLRYAIDGLTAILLTGAGLFLFGQDAVRFVDAGIGIALVGLIVLTPPLLTAAAQHSRAFLAIFALTWVSPVMLAAVRIANTFELLPFTILFRQTILALLAIEALLSAFAIVYRFHLLARERDDALQQEVAARLLADIDPLTGLLNRRALLRQAVGRGGEQTLMLADLDHFKLVNDTIGHDGGDEVLRVFARALRTALPHDALVARFGGEEFAILLPAESTIAPAALLDRVRATRMPFDLTITASIGSCSGPLRGETDWKALYRRADGALFAAKAAGRDRARDAEAVSQAA